MTEPQAEDSPRLAALIAYLRKRAELIDRAGAGSVAEVEARNYRNLATMNSGRGAR